MRSKKTDITMNEAAINHIIQQVSSNISNNIDEKFVKLQLNLKSFQKQLNKNRTDLIKIDHRVDSLEQYTRRCNLRFYGLQHPHQENVSTTLMNFIINHLKISDFTINDIEHSYKVSEQMCIAKFKSHEMKQKIYNSKKILKGTKFVIREDLTVFRHKAVLAAVSKYGPSNVWTIDGKIRLKIQGDTIKPTLEDLEKIIDEAGSKNAVQDDVGQTDNDDIFSGQAKGV